MTKKESRLFTLGTAGLLLLRIPLIAETISPDLLWERQSETNAVQLNHEVLQKILVETQKGTAKMSLPLPDGTFRQFEIVESQIMEPELAEQFPELRTYVGRDVDDSTATVQIDSTPQGFHAQIISTNGTIYIDPCYPGETNIYSCLYNREGLKRDFKCGETPTAPESKYSFATLRNAGNVLRTFRIAVAAQGEFTAFHGGTKVGAMSAIVTIFNRVNGIYQAELGVRFVIVAGNERIVYTDASTDPFSANGFTEQILLENQRNTDSVIGSANYDLGIALNTSGEGLAYARSVCVEGYKARSVIGISEPTGDYFAVGYVAHEIGHQFGAYHTFNSMNDKCNGRRFPQSAFEPGSGSTIMSYSGICGADDLQEQRDAYFNAGSLDEIFNFLNSGTASCAAISSTGNNPPSASAGGDFAIPIGTPFTLTASGSDPDGDRVTFCWEQTDLGPAQSVYDSDNGSSPLFRSHVPTANPARTFPRMQELLQNTRLRGEQLPSTDRTMNFRITTRDGRGGIGNDAMQITVVGSAGPFAVTAPNSEVTWSGTRTLQWNVAGTTRAPINATRVNILLSTDGGTSFPTVLSANTPNDGMETVVLPNINTSTARIKIAAVGNVFFDISDVNFSITPSQGGNPSPQPQPSPSTWRAVGANDFNGDGSSDLLLFSNLRSLSIRFLNGTNRAGSVLIKDGAAVAANWRFVALTDFNLDGSSDMLWQHADGRCAVWLMNGATFSSSTLLRDGQAAAPGWKAIGTGDFNADGSRDLLFRHSDGKMAVWFFSGMTFVRSSLLLNGGQLPSSWTIAGVGDFNSDGNSDLLLRHTQGNLAVWLLNGTQRSGGAQLRNGQAVSTAWRVVCVTDFNSDGRVDIVWQHTNGSISVWLMNGMDFIGGVGIR